MANTNSSQTKHPECNVMVLRVDSNVSSPRSSQIAKLLLGCQSEKQPSRHLSMEATPMETTKADCDNEHIATKKNIPPPELPSSSSNPLLMDFSILSPTERLERLSQEVSASRSRIAHMIDVMKMGTHQDHTFDQDPDCQLEQKRGIELHSKEKQKKGRIQVLSSDISDFLKDM
eukprot:gene24262-1547_t